MHNCRFCILFYIYTHNICMCARFNPHAVCIPDRKRSCNHVWRNVMHILCGIIDNSWVLLEEGRKKKTLSQKHQKINCTFFFYSARKQSKPEGGGGLVCTQMKNVLAFVNTVMLITHCNLFLFTSRTTTCKKKIKKIQNVPSNKKLMKKNHQKSSDSS